MATPTQITSLQIVSSTEVTGEIAAAGTAAQTWTLAHTPAQSIVKVFVNGLRQTPGQSYSIQGETLTSPFWQTTDTVVCDYSY